MTASAITFTIPEHAPDHEKLKCIKRLVDTLLPGPSEPIVSITTSSPSTTPLELRLRRKRDTEGNHSLVQGQLTRYNNLSTDAKASVDRKVSKSKAVMENHLVFKALKPEPVAGAPPAVSSLLLAEWKGLGSKDRDMWSRYMKEFHKIDLSFITGGEITDFPKHGIVVPVGNPNSHNYTIGLPVMWDGTSPSSLFRMDNRGTSGNTLTKDWECLRRADENEIRAFWTCRLFP